MLSLFAEMLLSREVVCERPRAMGGEMLSLRRTLSPVSVGRRSLRSKSAFLTVDHEIAK